MQPTITYDLGHAHVAAIRVLIHRLSRPPTVRRSPRCSDRSRSSPTTGSANWKSWDRDARGESIQRWLLRARPLGMEQTFPVEYGGLPSGGHPFRSAKKSEEFVKMFEDGADEKEKYSKLEDELRSFRRRRRAPKKAPSKGDDLVGAQRRHRQWKRVGASSRAQSMSAAGSVRRATKSNRFLCGAQAIASPTKAIATADAVGRAPERGNRGCSFVCVSTRKPGSPGRVVADFGTSSTTTRRSSTASPSSSTRSWVRLLSRG